MEDNNSVYSDISDPFVEQKKEKSDLFCAFFSKIGYINFFMLFAIPIFWLVLLAATKPNIVLDYPDTIKKVDSKYNVCYSEECKPLSPEDEPNAIAYGEGRISLKKYFLWSIILSIFTLVTYFVIRASAKF